MYLPFPQISSPVTGIIIPLAHSVTQLYLTLCGPMDSSPPGSSAHEILQARILERFSTSYSRIFSQTRDWTRVSCSSCFGRWILYHSTHWEAPKVPINCSNLVFLPVLLIFLKPATTSSSLSHIPPISFTFPIFRPSLSSFYNLYL